MSVLAKIKCYILPICQGTARCGEMKYFAKYSLTAMPVTLPLVPTSPTLSRGIPTECYYFSLHNFVERSKL